MSFKLGRKRDMDRYGPKGEEEEEVRGKFKRVSIRPLERPSRRLALLGPEELEEQSQRQKKFRKTTEHFQGPQVEIKFIGECFESESFSKCLAQDLAQEQKAGFIEEFIDFLQKSVVNNQTPDSPFILFNGKTVVPSRIIWVFSNSSEEKRVSYLAVQIALLVESDGSLNVASDIKEPGKRYSSVIKSPVLAKQKFRSVSKTLIRQTRGNVELKSFLVFVFEGSRFKPSPAPSYQVSYLASGDFQPRPLFSGEADLYDESSHSYIVHLPVTKLTSESLDPTLYKTYPQQQGEEEEEELSSALLGKMRISSKHVLN